MGESNSPPSLAPEEYQPSIEVAPPTTQPHITTPPTNYKNTNQPTWEEDHQRHLAL